MKSKRLRGIIAALMVATTAVTSNAALISAAAETEQGAVQEQKTFRIEFPENVSVCYADDWGLPRVDPSNVNPNKRIVISSGEFFAVTKDDGVGTPYEASHYKAELNWKDPQTHKQTRPYVWRGYLTEDAKVVCPGIKPNDYFRIGETSNTRDGEYVLAANGCSMEIGSDEQLKTEGYEGYHMGRTYFEQSENGIGIYLKGGIGTKADPYVFGENFVYDSAVDFDDCPDELHPGDVILSGAELTFKGEWYWNMWISNYAYGIQQDYHDGDGDGIKVYFDENRNCHYCAVMRNGGKKFEVSLPDGNAVVFDDNINGYHYSQCWYDSETGKTTPAREKQEETEEEIPEETPEVVEDEKLNVKFSGHSMSFDGDIALNFYTEINEEDLSDDAYMHLVQDGKAVDIKVNDAKIVNDTENNITYHVFKYSVDAKDMTSDVVAQLIDGDKESNISSYSVRAYADSIFTPENRKRYEKAVPLVEAMLNYGAYTQVFFKSTAPLANEGLENTDISDVTSETVGERPTEANLPEGVTFAGATLTATSETATTLFFKSNKPLTFKYNGQEMETKISGDYQTCTIKGIKSNFIDRYLTLEVSDGTENGTIKYNPITYCINTINRKDVSEEQRNVSKALFKYSEASKAYFG